MQLSRTKSTIYHFRRVNIKDFGWIMSVYELISDSLINL